MPNVTWRSVFSPSNPLLRALCLLACVLGLPLIAFAASRLLYDPGHALQDVGLLVLGVALTMVTVGLISDTRGSTTDCVDDEKGAASSL